MILPYFTQYSWKWSSCLCGLDSLPFPPLQKVKPWNLPFLFITIFPVPGTATDTKWELKYLLKRINTKISGSAPFHHYCEYAGCLIKGTLKGKCCSRIWTVILGSLHPLITHTHTHNTFISSTWIWLIHSSLEYYKIQCQQVLVSLYSSSLGLLPMYLPFPTSDALPMHPQTLIGWPQCASLALAVRIKVIIFNLKNWIDIGPKKVNASVRMSKPLSKC